MPKTNVSYDLYELRVKCSQILRRRYIGKWSLENGISEDYKLNRPDRYLLSGCEFKIAVTEVS